MNIGNPTVRLVVSIIVSFIVDRLLLSSGVTDLRTEEYMGIYGEVPACYAVH